jgi:hypothetical protein
MPKQELNLLQLTAGHVTQPRRRAPQIVWSMFRDTQPPGICLDNVPDYFFRHCLAPSSSSPADAPE